MKECELGKYPFEDEIASIPIPSLSPIGTVEGREVYRCDGVCDSCPFYTNNGSEARESREFLGRYLSDGATDVATMFLVEFEAIKAEERSD